MKYILTLLLFTATATGFAQATTQSEFNYIKRGLKDVDEKGMDEKTGYTLGDLQTNEFGNVKVWIRPVTRNSDGSLAGISIITYTTGLMADSKKYYCLPAPSLQNKTSFGIGDWQQDVDLMTLNEMRAVLKTISYNYTVEAVYHIRNKQ